jgi:hypothetical protein
MRVTQDFILGYSQACRQGRGTFLLGCVGYLLKPQVRLPLSQQVLSNYDFACR